MGVEIQIAPGAPPLQVPAGAQSLPPEPEPWRTLIQLGLLRRNVTADPSDHARYALTGLGWAAIAGGAWLALRRRSSRSSESSEGEE